MAREEGRAYEGDDEGRPGAGRCLVAGLGGFAERAYGRMGRCRRSAGGCTGNGTAYMPQGTEDTQPGDALGTPDAQGSDTGSPSSGSDAPDPDGQQPGVRNQAIQTPDANGNETSGSTEGQAIDATNGPVGTSRSTTAGAIEVWRGYLSNTSDADKVGSDASLGEAVQAAAALESTAKLVYVRSDYTLEEDVVLPTGVTLYVYGEGYSEGDLGAVLTVPAGKTLSVEADQQEPERDEKLDACGRRRRHGPALRAEATRQVRNEAAYPCSWARPWPATLSVPAGEGARLDAANQCYHARATESAIVGRRCPTTACPEGPSCFRRSLTSFPRMATPSRCWPTKAKSLWASVRAT